MLQSCSQELKQSESPTAPSASEKIDSTSKNGAGKHKTVSGVQPLVPYWNEGAKWTYSQWNFYKRLPEDSAKGKYLVVGLPPSGVDYASMYQQYCFRRAICSSGQQLTDVTTAGFSRAEILVGIGANDYQSVINQYGSSVLGYFIDEPSGTNGVGQITGEEMSQIKIAIITAGSKLYLDDYDTGVIPGTYVGVHSYHLADAVTLGYGDFIWNDGNTSKWVSGANILGIDYLQDDYNEFQSWFGDRLNGIVCKPMDGSGALMNDQTMWSWLQSHPNCNNFVLYLDPAFQSDWPAALSNFEADASQAGFLGTENQLYDYQFVCQESGVRFTPNGTAFNYYGVWDGSGYSGPVIEGTAGAVVCWQLLSTTPTGQFQDIY